MRRWVIGVVLTFAVAGVWWVLRAKPPLGEAYIGERAVTLWSRVAQVREPIAAARYGEKVAILERKGEQVRVRTSDGATGWTEAPTLIEPGVWQRGELLLAQTRKLPAQARGHTKVSSNVRVEAGRGAPRIYQFSRGAAVEVLDRGVATLADSPEDARPASKDPALQERGSRQEDWLLVRGFASANPGGAEGSVGNADGMSGSEKLEGAIPIAGWVLARFVELDPPDPVRDYAASAGMRVVAWFELNRVTDSEGEKPQYLAAGVRGAEGQPCDFTMIRVYTWGSERQRYETAYRESSLCGRLPIRVGEAAAGFPEFQFAAVGRSGTEDRVYEMRHTVVRRVRDSHLRRPRR